MVHWSQSRNCKNFDITDGSTMLSSHNKSFNFFKRPKIWKSHGKTSGLYGRMFQDLPLKFFQQIENLNEHVWPALSCSNTTSLVSLPLHLFFMACLCLRKWTTAHSGNLKESKFVRSLEVTFQEWIFWDNAVHYTCIKGRTCYPMYR